MDWYHTWSIHGVNQNEVDSTIPANYAGITDTDNSDSKTAKEPARGTCAGRKRSLNCQSILKSIHLEQLEFNATDHLHRCHSQVQKQTEKRARSSVANKTTGSHNDGNAVRIWWIDDHSDENDVASMKEHLYVEVRIEEVLSAVVVFCYYNYTTGSDDSVEQLDNFEFCLVRGLRSSYETIFDWMTTITDGCLSVGSSTLHFTSDDLSQILSSWIQMEFQQSKFALTKSNETTKQMMLTFETPSAVAAAGLDTISLAVPPQALLNMYTYICDMKPTNTTETSHQLQMVRAMQIFIEDAFAIDVTTFPLIKVVTTYATLGSDGRFKPTTNDPIPRTLKFLRPSVQVAKEIFCKSKLYPL